MRALTVEDAATLKLALGVILSFDRRWTRRAIDKKFKDLPTPKRKTAEVLGDMSRLEVNATRVISVQRNTRNGRAVVDFGYLPKERDVPGGADAVYRAICVRMYQLIKIPLPPEIRNDPEKGPLSTEKIDRLSKTVRIADPEPVVH